MFDNEKVCLKSVYEIVHISSGRKYIGQTRNLKARWRNHISAARSITQKQYIHRAMSKHGIENFIFNVLWSGDCSQLELDCFERFQIAFWQTKIKGFNETDGGGGCVGFKMPADAIKKVIRATTGRTRSPEQKARISAAKKGRPNGHLGLKRSEETCRRISLAKQSISDESRKRISDAAKLRCAKRRNSHV